MINKIVIENFRCFKRFQLSSLKQLNIIVGDNNSGKTAFLEAVSIACKPTLKHLFWLVQQRIENPDSITSIQEELDFLFNTVNEKAKIEVENEAGEFFIDVAKNIEVDSQKSFSLYASKKECFAVDIHSGVQFSEKEICEERQFIYNEKLSSKDFSQLNAEIKSKKSLKPEQLNKIVAFLVEDYHHTNIFINSIYKLKEKYLIQLLIQLETLKFEDRATWKNDALPFLQKIYPDLVGVEFGRNSRIIIETATGALPLSYMGDGFKKSFYLFLAVYCCKDGVLIIDELEIGIHYENQQAVWQMLLSASKKFNTQLFISTHSYEMLEYLQKAIENQSQEDKTHWQEELSLFSFVKLNKTPSSYYHDYDYFSELVKSKCELR
jgi:AAA15 family ATPase/GTPase